MLWRPPSCGGPHLVEAPGLQPLLPPPKSGPETAHLLAST